MEGKKEIENNNFKEFLTKYGGNSPPSKAVGGIALPLPCCYHFYVIYSNFAP